jgi:hypothetical protein
MVTFTGRGALSAMDEEQALHMEIPNGGDA